MRATLLVLAAAAAGCASLDPAPRPPWDGRLYVGDSSRAGLYRAQADEVIACSDVRVDAMLCMSADDFKTLLQSVRFPAVPAAGAGDEAK